MAFSPDGQRLASASVDGTVIVWDARTGQGILTLKGHADNVTSVAFSPDGEYLASGSEDETVIVWDARTGRQAIALGGHTGSVTSVAFSPDGRRLASGSEDRTVKLWDVSTGQEALTLKGHGGGVTGVTFSPDGRRLASAGKDRTVRVWDATPVSERSNLQYQALCSFRFAAGTLILKDEVIRQIRESPALSEPVREQALAFAQEYRENPTRLNDASWSFVRRPRARPAACALALRQAEAACRAEPENGSFHTTLGAAQYRNRRYEQALKTLTRADELNVAGFEHPLPAALAFLALTQLALGRKAEAVAMLGRVRDSRKKVLFDRETEELLEETERAVESKK